MSVSSTSAAGTLPLDPTNQSNHRSEGFELVQIPIHVDRPQADQTSPQPIRQGIPIPRALLASNERLSLADANGRDVPLQHRALNHWSDGSPRWILLDFIIEPNHATDAPWTLSNTRENLDSPASTPSIHVHETKSGHLTVNTGQTCFLLQPGQFPFSAVRYASLEPARVVASHLNLTDDRGRVQSLIVERMTVLDRGPVRATIRVAGHFKGRATCQVIAHLDFFATTGLVRIQLTLRNPRRAQHRGGLWDLGDPGSILIRDLTLSLKLPSSERPAVVWSAEPETAPAQSATPFEIYQDSSGGEYWQSRVHVDRSGRSPCQFRGYRLRASDHRSTGRRANPVVSLRSDAIAISAAIPDFWQQFPKAIEVDESATLHLRLFPHQSTNPHELQGGEQKTHTIWLNLGLSSDAPETAALAWVHNPPTALPAPEWTIQSQAVPYLKAHAPQTAGLLAELLESIVAGDRNYMSRRDQNDLYGWRNFGEIHADHEDAYYEGTRPIISHYNNQYDSIMGFAVHALRSGDRRWLALHQELARHVIDVDIYHTSQDRPAYNGGMFWHTDHYRDAATSSHRAYSRANVPPNRSYGGGPCNEHNYTTGLLHYHYLTGDPLASEAVLSLADWVIAMDDGAGTVLGLVDDGPTGLASRTTEPDYHGPGRGAGNSLNALLDAWLLTCREHYLSQAETLLRRVIHPHDDINGLILLDAERRWSYTVFLSVLVRYLDLKSEAGQMDSTYFYAKDALSHYARWMAENERPYLDHPDELEYPTETWAAQDLRKANVLRLASAFEHDVSLAGTMQSQADRIADRAWLDLARFSTRDTARPLALVMLEGWRDCYLRGFNHSAQSHDAGPPRSDVELGHPIPFSTQKARVLAALRSPRVPFQLLKAIVSLPGWNIRRITRQSTLKSEALP